MDSTLEVKGLNIEDHWTTLRSRCKHVLSSCQDMRTSVIFGLFALLRGGFPKLSFNTKMVSTMEKKQQFNSTMFQSRYAVGTELHLVPTSSSRDRHLSPCVLVRSEGDCHPHRAESFHHLELEIPRSSRKCLLVPQETLAKLVYN